MSGLGWVISPGNGPADSSFLIVTRQETPAERGVEICAEAAVPSSGNCYRS